MESEQEWRQRVGRRIKMCRQALKLSQPELGSLANLPRTTISNMERGERAIVGAYDLLTLARVMEVDVRWFMAMPGIQTPKFLEL